VGLAGNQEKIILDAGFLECVAIHFYVISTEGRNLSVQ